MDKSRKPSVYPNHARGAAVSLPPGQARPMGLLYTMLRHGRGLSAEEAHHISFESIHGQPVQGHPDKAA